MTDSTFVDAEVAHEVEDLVEANVVETSVKDTKQVDDAATELHSKKRKWKSLGAQQLAEMGELALAEEDEADHLECQGRIIGSDKTVNAFGKIDSARLYRYNPDQKTVVIRLDHSTIPEFWAEVTIPENQLASFIRREK